MSRTEWNVPIVEQHQVRCNNPISRCTVTLLSYTPTIVVSYEVDEIPRRGTAAAISIYGALNHSRCVRLGLTWILSL